MPGFLAKLDRFTIGLIASVGAGILVPCSGVWDTVFSRLSDAAIILLHYSDIEIDNIASKCGYCDRSHFSKAFKKTTGVAPASYRKKARAF